MGMTYPIFADQIREMNNLLPNFNLKHMKTFVLQSAGLEPATFGSWGQRATNCSNLRCVQPIFTDELHEKCMNTMNYIFGGGGGLEPPSHDDKNGII